MKHPTGETAGQAHLCACDFDDWTYWVTNGGKNLMAILAGFGDESGPRADGTFLVTVTVLSKEGADALFAELAPQLAVRHIHWIDLVHGKGAHKDVDPKVREALMNIALEAIHGRIKAAGVVSCSIKDISALFPNEKNPARVAYGVCSFCAIDLLGAWAWVASHGINYIQYIFEHGPFRGEALSLKESFEPYKEIREDYQFAGLDVKPKEDCFSFFIADCVGWELGRFLERHAHLPRKVRTDPNNPPERRQELFMLPLDRVYGRELTREGFREQHSRMLALRERKRHLDIRAKADPKWGAYASQYVDPSRVFPPSERE